MNTDEKARPDQAPAAETVVEQLIEKMRTCPREVSSAVVDDWAEELDTVLALLRAVPPAPPPEGRDWQPFAMAPKDGTRLLLWNGHRRCLGWYARYSDTSEGWHRQNLIGEPLGLKTDLVDDTHWMPLPDPPTAAR
jgi:hypothetical protein